MDLKVIEQFLDQASRRSENVKCIWHGGEPLLAGVETFNRILEMQHATSASREVCFCNLIQTNGTLIDQEWIDLFRRGNFGVGVSLDGPQWLHDACRKYVSGRGSYRDTMQGIRRLQTEELEFATLSVVTKASLGHADEIFRFFTKEGIRRFDFLPCVEVLSASDKNKESVLLDGSLDQGDFAEFLISIFDLWFEHDDPSITVRCLEEMVVGLLGGRPSLCKFNNTCREYVTINYDGTVSACDNFTGYEELVFGNLGQQSLDAILDGDKRRRFVGAVSTRRPECMECEYFSACGGGCSRYSYMWNRDFQGENFFCKDRKRVFRHISRKLHDEHPQLLLAR